MEEELTGLDEPERLEPEMVGAIDTPEPMAEDD